MYCVLVLDIITYNPKTYKPNGPLRLTGRTTSSIYRSVIYRDRPQWWNGELSDCLPEPLWLKMMTLQTARATLPNTAARI